MAAAAAAAAAVEIWKETGRGGDGGDGADALRGGTASKSGVLTGLARGGSAVAGDCCLEGQLIEDRLTAICHGIVPCVGTCCPGA